MRVIKITAIFLSLSVSLANAQIRPETVGRETMPAPGANWFMAKTNAGGYIYDATNGEMHGLVSLSSQTPAVQPSMARREFYAAESYYSRGVHGARTDVLTIYDFDNLAPVAEVEIPKKITVLPFREYIGMMDDGRHVGIFNMTPAQSVTVVDVADRNVAGEISTPGCALIMPVAGNGFLMICGDGTLQLIRLNADGGEASRVRSNGFFDVQVDPVYDRPAATRDGWFLLSHGGKAYTVATNGNRINVSDSWSILGEEDEGWLPGGQQVLSVHKGNGLLYVLMHEGKQYSHHEAGTEIWVVSLAGKRRIARIELEEPASSIMVTQESDPRLVVGDEDGKTHIYHALTFKKERTIEGPGAPLFIDL